MSCFTDDLGPCAYLLASAGRSVVSHSSELKRSCVNAIMDNVKIALGRAGRTALASLPGRTPLETRLIAGASIYSVWKFYDLGGFGYVSRKARFFVPGLSWARSLMGKYDVVHAPHKPRQCNILESRRPGSEENFMTSPRCQAVVAYKDDGKMVVIGNVMRFDRNYIVGPDHVLGGPVSDAKYVKGSQAWVSLEGKERVFLDTDLVAIQLSDKELSQIGVSVCKIAVLPDSGMMAQVVGPESKGTIGVLRHDPRLFGRVVYEGTTLSGYSGAAYVAGNGVLGVHQSGGVVNSGYSASYVWNLILLANGAKLESSEDWLLGQFKHSKKLEWRTCAAPDEVLVRVNGQYARVEIDSMYRAFGPDWRENERFERNVERGYSDGVPEAAVPTFSSNAQAKAESGECRSSEHPGVSSVLEKAQECEPLSPPELLDAYKRLSTKQRESFRRLAKLRGLPTTTTSGQASIL